MSTHKSPGSDCNVYYQPKQESFRHVFLPLRPAESVVSSALAERPAGHTAKSGRQDPPELPFGTASGLTLRTGTCWEQVHDA
jgi:hypothetical protein